jgi:hypothetical protein
VGRGTGHDPAPFVNLYRANMQRADEDARACLAAFGQPIARAQKVDRANGRSYGQILHAAGSASRWSFGHNR